MKQCVNEVIDKMRKKSERKITFHFFTRKIIE